jgi:hypothetical protein
MAPPFFSSALCFVINSVLSKTKFILSQLLIPLHSRPHSSPYALFWTLRKRRRQSVHDDLHLDMIDWATSIYVSAGAETLASFKHWIFTS